MKRLSLIIPVGVADALVLFVLTGILRAWLEEQRHLVDNRLPDIAYAAIAADPALRTYSLDLCSRSIIVPLIRRCMKCPIIATFMAGCGITCRRVPAGNGRARAERS